MRPTGRLLIHILALIVIFTIPVAALAQKPPASAKSTSVSEDAIGAEKASEPVALPSDLLTRENFDKEPTDTKSLGPDASDYFRVFIGMAVVIGVIWGLSLVMKRLVIAKGLVGSTECLKILYTLSLTPGRTLYLVRLVDRVLLIGAGEGGIRTLTEITDPEEVSAILKELEFKGNFDLNPFRERLKNLMNNGEQDAPPDEDLESVQRKMKGTLDRLKNTGDNNKNKE
jgi:flagellar biogenesis protein FliO